MTIQIKHKLTGEVLYSSERDTMRGAVLEAVEKRANLRSADLRYADLRSANLRSANLSYANLRYANLRYADLRYAENITTAHFQYSYGGNSVAQQLQVGAYQLTIIEDTLWGGCTKMKLTEWLEYDGEELRESDKNYLEYVTKPFILMVMCQRELGGE